jgi:hypothetical protein
MGGKKRRKKTVRKKSESLSEAKPSKGFIRGFLSSFWGLICSISVVLGIVGTIFAFLTKISVQSENSLTPFNLSMATFIVSNDSMLPLSDVSYGCKTYNVTPNKVSKEFLTGKEGELGSIDTVEVSPGPAYLYSTLQPGDKESFECMTLQMAMVEKPIRNADLDMAISYRPLWILWKQERKFKFKAKETDDGKIIWIPSGN